MQQAEWETEATLASGTEDLDGIECHVIELTFEAEGDMEEPQFGGRGRDRDFVLGPDGALWALVETTYEVELEGSLYFSVEDARPVKIELEGELTIEMDMERGRDDFTMRIQRTQEGEIEHTVTIEEIK